jgi:hypothetical protein
VPLITFFKSLGMSIVSAMRVDTHGGSVRVCVVPLSNQMLDTSILPLLEGELKLDDMHKYADFAKTIEQRRDELQRIIGPARAAGATIAGYGAPAKATTLIRTFGIEDAFDFIVDDSPHKQGRWMPGGRIPVLPSSAIMDRRPDMVVILAWNFADSILKKLDGYRAAGGKCVVPLPEVRIV